MKHIFRILTAVALTASMVSCNKEKIDENGKTGIGGRISVSVSGLLGEYTPETKSELVNTVRVAWKDDDVVFVYDGTKTLGELTARIEDEEGRYAKLTGTINQPSGTTLYLLHGSSLSSAPAIEDGKVSVSLAEQNTDTAPFVVYSTLDYTNGETSIKDLTVPFHFGTSVVRVSCSGLEPMTNVSRAEISDVNTSCVLTFGNGSVEVSGADPGTIFRTGAKGFDSVNAEGDAAFQLAVPELENAVNRTLAVWQGEVKYQDVNFAKSAIKVNKSVNTICTMDICNDITPESPEGTIGYIDGRKAMVVNLDGARYAVALMNEGATAETGTDSYGDFYTFQEASPYHLGTSLNVWRAPVASEYKALFTKKEIRNNLSSTAMEVVITDDKCISFPYAGYTYGEGIEYKDYEGMYMTSTVGEQIFSDVPEEFFAALLLLNVDNPDYSRHDVSINREPQASASVSLRLFYQLTEKSIPEDNILSGEFTVNEQGDKVYFSKGNLYYDGGYFKFEDRQVDYESEWKSSHVSLFHWCEDANNAAAEEYVKNDAHEFFAAKDFTVGDVSTWRVLTLSEWDYLINKRDVGYAYAAVDGAYGIIIFHDGYSGQTEGLTSIPDGCVFMPGIAKESEGIIRASANYWTATGNLDGRAYSMLMDFYGLEEYNNFGRAFSTYSYQSFVRLVTDCK